MFTKHISKSFHVAIGAGLVGAIFAASAARAEDPAVRTPSVMNQDNNVYAETLKFYLHPARLEVIEAPRERMDHPAVIVARRPPAGFDWTTAFILHPARLEVVEAPRPMIDHPAVIVAKTKRVPHDSTAKFTVHPAVAVSKARQAPQGYTAKLTPSAADE